MIGEKNSWGKGYATEAISLLADFAFSKLNLHKLIAGCYEQNQGSLKAFQKAGLEIDGVRRKHWFSNGKYVDVYLLGKINSKEEKNGKEIG
jgi:RimJ/RimL family protein N-acetyltransferase